jgi:hypothetical protein
MIGIVFRPAAIYTLLALPMYEFSNIRMNLVDVWKKLTKFKIELPAKTHQDRIRILDNYLTGSGAKTHKTPV